MSMFYYYFKLSCNYFFPFPKQGFFFTFVRGRCVDQQTGIWSTTYLPTNVFTTYLALYTTYLQKNIMNIFYNNLLKMTLT
jgi:hypothetical protein